MARTDGSTSGHAVPATAVGGTEARVASWAWDGIVDPVVDSFADPLQNPWDKPGKSSTRPRSGEQGEIGSAHGVDAGMSAGTGVALPSGGTDSTNQVGPLADLTYQQMPGVSFANAGLLNAAFGDSGNGAHPAGAAAGSASTPALPTPSISSPW